MNSVRKYAQLFENLDFSAIEPTLREYDDCHFINCQFHKSMMDDCHFLDCKFEQCDLSMAIVKNVVFNGVQFVNCRLMGIDFAMANNFIFEVAFSDCILDYSSFFQKKMKKTKFEKCSFKETGFEQTVLEESVFTDCDLMGAVFIETNLKKCDFRSAWNYSIDPENNNIKKAKFSLEGVRGLLDKYGIVIE